VFVIENNQLRLLHAGGRAVSGGTELWQRAAGYGIEGLRLDCGDTEAVTRTLAAAIAKVRATSRPVLIEAHTWRLRGHAAYDTCDYLQARAKATDSSPPSRCPSCAPGWRANCGAARLDAIDGELNEFVEACIRVSLPTPRPSPAGMEARTCTRRPLAPALGAVARFETRTRNPEPEP
jgi:2-oxoisovalerate dehydrogenase E1 component